LGARKSQIVEVEVMKKDRTTP